MHFILRRLCDHLCINFYIDNSYFAFIFPKTQIFNPKKIQANSKKESEILKGKFDNDSISLDSEIISNLKNAPITSVDVERSFSVYKNILTDKRQSFLLANLEKHLIINCYSSIKNKD